MSVPPGDQHRPAAGRDRPTTRRAARCRPSGPVVRHVSAHDRRTGHRPATGPTTGRRAAHALRVGAARTGRVVGRGTMAGAGWPVAGSKAGARRARAYTHSAGAGESGLARLVELHFVNLMGDAALTVSLAGTIFAIPTDEARGQVAQFLALTMAPFALLAPFIGPLLDRFRHGRRWAIGTTLALRAFLCWVLAGAVANDSPWLFPAALGCLVASKAYGVTRASAVPRLLPPGFSLVNANSRNALAGVAGMAVGGGLAGARLPRIGPEWSLRLAFVIYVAGTVLAIRLPSRVDSSTGEQDIEDTGPLPVPRGDGRRLGLFQRLRARVAALPVPVLDRPVQRGGRPAAHRVPHPLHGLPHARAPAARAQRHLRARPGRRRGRHRQRPGHGHRQRPEPAATRPDHRRGPDRRRRWPRWLRPCSTR